MAVCPALASSLSREACFLLRENKSLNENDKLRAEDVFFSYSQIAGSSSCCILAIKIVFHSAFALYITKATTVFFFTFSNVDSFTEPKEEDIGRDNLPGFFSFQLICLNSGRVSGLL